MFTKRLTLGVILMICTSLLAADELTLIHPQLTIVKHLTLAPGEGNPRNSEGDFIKLKDGRWLFIYTRFTGGSSDHASAELASRESTDGGRNWSREDKVVVKNEGGFNVMSVSLLRLKSGGMRLKEAAAEVAEATGHPRNALYQAALANPAAR